MTEEEITTIKQEEAERIFTQFCIARTALVMYQTNEAIHWTAEELRKEMSRICGIDEMQANCEHEWEEVAGKSSMETWKLTAWIYHCKKCKATKEETTGQR